MTEVLSNLISICVDYISCREERSYNDATSLLGLLVHFGQVAKVSILKAINTHETRYEQTIELNNKQDDILRHTMLIESSFNDVTK